jgi:predicted aconitase with swiveling domain
MIISNCKKIVGGTGEGKILVTKQPINFLSMVNAKTGVVTDPKHELYNKSIKRTVLVIPYAIGSSVGAYAIYSLQEYEAAPSAVVCLKADIITASGCAIANIPVVDLPEEMAFSIMQQGTVAKVEADIGKITLKMQE